MPIRIREQHGHGTGSTATNRASRRELRWLVTGTNDPITAEAALASQGLPPLIFGGLIFDSLTSEAKPPQTFEFTASYKDPQKEDEDKLEEGEFRFAFDTTGGTLHISSNPNGTTPYGGGPNFLGAINVDADRIPQGVDITIPAMQYRLTYQFPDDHFVDFDSFLDYSATVESLTATTNNAEVLKRAAGELLFLGGNGQWSTKSGPQIEYQFAASKNKTGITIGNIPNIDKLGHAYLWIWYEGEVAADVRIPKPKCVYVEDLYKSEDWTALNVPLIGP